MKRHKQQGFNLIELMIAIVLALLAMTAVTALFLSMIRSDADNMKMIRLSQELRAAMSLMTRDIRRAGGNFDPTGTNWNSIAFSAINFTSTISGSVPPKFKAMTFSYDYTKDGMLQPTTEIFGFKHNGSSINPWSSGAWSPNPLTDTNVININTLTFVPTTMAIVSPGTICVRQIDIELVGVLAADPTVKRRMVENIKIRNDNIDNTGSCP